MTTLAHEINQPLNALSMYLLRREGRWTGTGGAGADKR